MLKSLVKKDEFEALPDAIKEHYKAEGEDYVLETQDAELRSRIASFRDNNVDLRRQIEAAKKDLEKFSNIDPKKYEEAVSKLQELEEKQLLDANQIEEVIALRTERMRGDYEGKITAMQSSLEAATQSQAQVQGLLQKELLAGRLARSVTKVSKPNPGALDYIEKVAADTWKLVDNDLVPMSGDEVLYGKDGKAQLSMEEWVTDLVERSPFLFQGSSGTGAPGNGSNSHGGSKTIDRHDPSAFSGNLESIAKGEVKAM